MTVHNHPPYRPVCNERKVNGQLRGACLTDDGQPIATCPTACVEDNHPGMEHEEWSRSLRKRSVTLGELEAAWRVGAGYLARAEQAERERDEARAALLRVVRFTTQRDVIYPKKFAFDASTNYVNGYKAAREDCRAAIEGP